MTAFDIKGLSRYMYELLVALRHVHAHNIIHYNVKPSHVLYNIRNGKALLVDFGLATSPPSSSSSSPSWSSAQQRQQ